MIDRCTDTTVHCSEGRNDGAEGDGYFICLSNSFRAKVVGGKLHARRHPVAIGGGDVVCGVPNRDCIVEGATLSNDLTTDVACADIHGNSERCGYRQCAIVGGVSLGGASPIASRCTITARQDGNIGEITEFKGGRIDMAGTTLSSPTVHVGGGRGLIDLGTQSSDFNASTVLDIELILTDFTLSAPNIAKNEAVVRLVNLGSPSRLTITMRRGSFHLGSPVQVLRTRGRPVRDQTGVILMEDLKGIPKGSFLHFSEDGSYRQSPKQTRNVS